jgi:hypothetical protein
MSERGESESSATFDYSGYLIFEPFQTKVQGRLEVDPSDEAKHEIDQHLPTFERGTPESPANGFEIIDIRKKLENSGILNQYSEVKDTISFKHIREAFELVEVYEDGEYVEAPTVSINTVDVYWNYPNFIYLKGAKAGREKTFSRLRNLFVDSLYMKKISFDHEFFIWLFYKHYLDEDAEGVHIDQFHDVVLTGESDEFGRENKIMGSSDVLSSSTVLSGLLHGKELTKIEGAFRHNTGTIIASISNEKVHIKSGSGSIAQKSSIERISTAISFLTDLCRAHSTWTKLPPEDKYPPPQFFRELYEDALDQGTEVKSISSDVLYKYADLRDEDLNQTDE